jgi:peptide/nickel transport system permease protein
MDVYMRVYHELGLDKPLPAQYWNYLLNILTGDFGTSVITARPVLSDLLHVFPATLELSTVAIILGVVVGVPLGVMAAVNRGHGLDHFARLIGLVGYSMPIFWLGIIGLIVFYARLDWVSGPGRIDFAYDGLVEPITGALTVDSLIAGRFDVFRNALSHLVLPAVILGYFSLAYVARMTRSFMLRELGQDYILAARSKGLSRRRVIWRHAFPNILVPLASVIALSYGSLLEGAVLTETVFAWPGLGLYIKNGLFSADMNTVVGGTIVVGTVYVGLNLLADLVYRIADPRSR